MEFWGFFITILICLILDYCPWRPITFIVALLTTAYFGGVAIFLLLDIRRRNWGWGDIVGVIFCLFFVECQHKALLGFIKKLVIAEESLFLRGNHFSMQKEITHF